MYPYLMDDGNRKGAGGAFAGSKPDANEMPSFAGLNLDKTL